MKSIMETQKISVGATRSAFEKSAEVSRLCLEESLARQNISGWNTAVQRVLSDIPGNVKKREMRQDGGDALPCSRSENPASGPRRRDCCDA